MRARKFWKMRNRWSQPRNGTDEVDGRRRDRGPDVPRHRLPDPPEDLEGERRRVCAGDLVGADAE